MARLLSCIFFFTFFAGIYAQVPLKTESAKATKYYGQGVQNYNLKVYPLAEDYLKLAIKTDIKFQNAYMVLAEVFWEQGKYKEAVEYYNSGLLIDPTFYPLGYLNMGKLNIKIADYDSALQSFKRYLELDSTNVKYVNQAKRGIQQAQFAIEAIAHPVSFEPINLGPKVNTPLHEYWPSLSADGNTLVITRMVNSVNNIKGRQEDFYFSNKINGEWDFMKEAGYPLNTPYDEGAQSISADGKLMVYTVCNRGGISGPCDIYYSEKEGDEWTFPKNIGPPINSSAKEKQPSLSADGRTIYFASDRAGTKGGLDIWMSGKNDDDIWQSPINLGDSINTEGNEASPFIHQDNNTLYFASDYLIGMGGLDIFVARRDEKGNWLGAKNLGYPINTSRDESGLIVNSKGDIAYFASDVNPDNGIDIFQFILYKEARPQEVSYLKGVVFDEKSRQRLQANFELYDLKDGALINQSISDGRTGEFLLCIPTNRNYMLNVNRTGYLFYSDNFSLKGIYHLDEPFMKDIPLKPIEAGEKIVLNNVFFETDSYKLKPESKYELNKVVSFLKVNPIVRIEISGHTDSIGTGSYNLTLSENRAKAVVKYLVDNSIDVSRLISKGYGFTEPLGPNETPEGRAKNRRTELQIID